MRTKKTVVVLFSGKAGSGKSTAAEMLTKKLNELELDTMLYGFADPIKYIAQAYGGWNKQKDEKGRRLLQDIGRIFRDYDSDIWVKHFLNQLDKRSGLFQKNFAIISDWRFPNELNYLKNNPLLDVVTIRVFGRGGLTGDTAMDVSENSLAEISTEHLEDPMWLPGENEQADHYYDFQIENSGDLELLNHKLDIVLAEIRQKYIVE